MHLQEKTAVSRSVLAVAFSVPLFAITALVLTVRQAEKSRAADEYVYQSQTLTEKMGAQRLTIPISPQVDLQYKCLQSENGENYLRHCADRRGDYVRDEIRMDVDPRAPSMPTLFRLHIKTVDQTCRRGNNRSYRCVTEKVRRAWCDRRADVAGSIWCTNRLDNRLEYRPYTAPDAFSAKQDKSDWAEESPLPNAPDHAGRPVEIACSRGRDSAVAQQQKNAARLTETPLGRFCRIKYKIAEDVEVSAKFNVPLAEPVMPQAQAAYISTQAFWRDMTVRAQ